MKLIQKGNRQLRVDDVRAEELIKAGYVEIDQKTGKPIVPETEKEKVQKAMEKENAALKKENKALQEQVADLTEKVKKAETAAKNAKKSAKAAKAEEPAETADPAEQQTE